MLFFFLTWFSFPGQHSTNTSHVYCAYMWYSSRAHCSSGFTGKGLKNPDREQLSISGRSYTNTIKKIKKKNRGNRQIKGNLPLSDKSHFEEPER